MYHLYMLCKHWLTEQIGVLHGVVSQLGENDKRDIVKNTLACEEVLKNLFR